MNNDKFISAYKIKKRFDITSNTLRTWADNDKINYIRIRDGKGKRMYNVDDVERIFKGSGSTVNEKKTYCYARVSSDHQKEDLNRQIELLQKTYPEAELLSDIGSGINFKRKGFQTLLERVYSGQIKRVVVTYKDRLCRFGSELVEWIFKKSNTELVVLNKLPGSEESGTKELAEDLLSITTVFVARNNGNRSANFRRQRKQEQEEKEIQIEKTFEG
jgi:predicted site-specific integrase-resolvase